MRIEYYHPIGKRWWVRLHEKGGKRHEMPRQEAQPHTVPEMSVYQEVRIGFTAEGGCLETIPMVALS